MIKGIVHIQFCFMILESTCRNNGWQINEENFANS